MDDRKGAEEAVSVARMSDELAEEIAGRLKIEKRKLVTLSITEIEKIAQIRPKPPSIDFQWEISEKQGWQDDHHRLVSDTELERREDRITEILKEKKATK